MTKCIAPVSCARIDERDLAATWAEQFERWFADARAGLPHEPTAMVFATADEHGQPSARTVLLKSYDERGFVLYTNLTSRKGREVLANPKASLVFPWYEIERQVVVVGRVERVSDEESDAYFATRPRDSQLGAHASPQSTVIPDRATLERAFAETNERYPHEIPRPSHWGGLRVVPATVEFWHGRPHRLHDRFRYREDGVVERLAP